MAKVSLATLSSRSCANWNRLAASSLTISSYRVESMLLTLLKYRAFCNIRLSHSVRRSIEAVSRGWCDSNAEYGVLLEAKKAEIGARG